MMTAVTALLLVLVVTGSMLAVLVALVVGRKAHRDRAEATMGERRRRYARTLTSRSPEEFARMVREATRKRAAQTDLLIELGFSGPGLDATSRQWLAEAATRYGLVPQLVGQLTARNPVARGRAGLLLARLRVPGVPSLVAPLLDDEDSDVRLAACAGLALTESAEAVRALTGALRAGLLAPERVVERLAAPWAVRPMLDVLAEEDGRDEASARVRALLARALGLTGDRAVEPALIVLLTRGGTEERISAARGLGATGGPASVLPLITALDDEAWPVRAQAARALGALGTTVAAARVAGLLTDEAWWVRAAAAEALGRLGGPGRAMLYAALRSTDRFARDRAREQLTLAADPVVAALPVAA